MSETESAHDGQHPMDAAMEAYRERFGSYPGTYGLEGIGRDRELLALVRKATETGVKLDVAAVAAAWGKTAPGGAST